jgi:hypothetical protein
VARECGIASAHTIEDAKQFREKIEMALSKPGPHFIRARIQTVDDERPPKSRRVPDPRENKYQFAAYIERTERVQIIGSGLEARVSALRFVDLDPTLVPERRGPVRNNPRVVQWLEQARLAVLPFSRLRDLG